MSKLRLTSNLNFQYSIFLTAEILRIELRIANETDPLTCPKCQGEMRISFIDQPEVIKKVLQHLGLWEESQAPPNGDLEKREITFDPSYSQLA